jgi:hypothetical protein
LQPIEFFNKLLFLPLPYQRKHKEINKMVPITNNSGYDSMIVIKINTNIKGEFKTPQFDRFETQL